MRKTSYLIVILAVMALTIGARADDGGGLRATAYLKDAAGDDAGIAHFIEDMQGNVRVDVRVKGLTPGGHGIHIHETGKCEPPFASAGAHYNPGGEKHGLGGTHAGDLPNIEVGRSGEGHLSTTTNRVTISPGNATLFDNDGSALVVHARPDDYVTDPAGGSGDRIACGVIVKS